MTAGRPRIRRRPPAHPVAVILYQARLLQKMTLAELASKSGLSADVLGRWERGERTPDSLVKLDKWATALGWEITLHDKRSKQVT